MDIFPVAESIEKVTPSGNICDDPPLTAYVLSIERGFPIATLL